MKTRHSGAPITYGTAAEFVTWQASQGLNDVGARFVVDSGTEYKWTGARAVWLSGGITLYDDTGTHVYIGHAPAGTATSSASWYIVRVTSSSGNTYPESSGALIAWDSRVSGTYS